MFLLELEAEAGFKILPCILNSRPIYASWALIPKIFLTGKANTEVPIRNYEVSDKPLHRLQYVDDCVVQRREQFMNQNFSSLVPRQSWFFKKRNMEVEVMRGSVYGENTGLSW